MKIEMKILNVHCRDKFMYYYFCYSIRLNHKERDQYMIIITGDMVFTKFIKEG